MPPAAKGPEALWNPESKQKGRSSFALPGLFAWGRARAEALSRDVSPGPHKPKGLAQEEPGPALSA